MSLSVPIATRRAIADNTLPSTAAEANPLAGMRRRLGAISAVKDMQRRLEAALTRDGLPGLPDFLRPDFRKPHLGVHSPDRNRLQPGLPPGDMEILDDIAHPPATRPPGRNLQLLSRA
jgi:hypothetical protein